MLLKSYEYQSDGINLKEPSSLKDKKGVFSSSKVVLHLPWHAQYFIAIKNGYCDVLL